MNVLESARLAASTIGHNRMRSGLTMLGIVIGVFAVISLVSLGHGAQQYVANQFAGMGSNLMIVTPGKQETVGHGPMLGASNVRKLTLDDADAIRRRVPEVTGVVPIIFGLGLVKYEGRSRNTMVAGVNHEFSAVRNLPTATGAFFEQADVESSRHVVAIGTRVARELFGDESALGQFVSVMGSPFRVVAVMEHRGTSLGFDLDDQVFIPVTAAKRLFNTDGLAEMLIQARDGESVEGARRSILDILKTRHNGEEDVTLVTQTQMLSTLDAILGALTATLAGIAAISLIVGGIGIMNILLVSVRERTREIGLRKAVGARSRDILVQFLVESVTLSVSGGVLGVILTLLCVMIARSAVPDLPVTVTPWAVVLAMGFSASVGVFFGVYPARRAARLDPLEALSTE